MWVAIFSALYSIPALLSLLVGLNELGRVICRKPDIRWARIALLVATLTGRRWLRLLRPASSDEPKPLTPSRKGIATGMGGVHLEWEEFGPPDAPALLLSHGWSLTHDTWYYQKTALSAEYRVIVWDMRGTGRSSAPTERDYSVNALVHDLAAVLRATDAGRQGCVLVGHSVGAMILPVFAAQFPDLIKSVHGLALLGGTDTPLLETMRGRSVLVPMRPWFWNPVSQLMAACPRPFELFAWLIWHLGVIHAALMFGMNGGGESRGQNDLVAEHCAQFSMRAAGLGAQACFDFDARTVMPKIAVPVLLLAGEADINMPLDIQRAMASRLVHPELVFVPNCGHLNLLECHEEVNSHLIAFARRCLTKMD